METEYRVGVRQGVCLWVFVPTLQLCLIFSSFYQITSECLPPPGTCSLEKNDKMSLEGEALNLVLV